MDTNAEKFRAWFKRTPLYFWLVLVIWEALKQAVPFAEFKGRVMELVISLVAGLVSVILLGQTGQIPDAGVNLFTLAIWLGVTVILRFVYGGFTIPAKLYQKMETVANLTSW